MEESSKSDARTLDYLNIHQFAQPKRYAVLKLIGLSMVLTSCVVGAAMAFSLARAQLRSGLGSLLNSDEQFAANVLGILLSLGAVFCLTWIIVIAVQMSRGR